jgi:predicted transcriptional regulator
MAASVKHELHQLAETLPENATWDDVIEEARFRRAVEAGVHAADRGAFATDEEVHAAFTRWGVKG